MNTSDRSIRKQVIDIVGKDELSSLRAINQYATLKDGIIIYLFGISSVLIAIFYGNFSDIFGVLSLLCAAVINGVLVNWINVQVHEASHSLLFRSKRINDFYINWLLGNWALHDVMTYRSTHDKHHSHLHMEQDPDREMYIGHARTSLIHSLLSDLCGWTALKRVKQVISMNRKTGKTTNHFSRLVPKAIAQCILLGLLTHNHGPTGVAIYATVILVPIFCIFPALIRVRTIVQHFDRRMLTDQEDQIWCSRSTVTGFVERIIIGARMDYHFEHHLLPSIPYYNLQKLHLILKENGFFDHDESRDFTTHDFVKSSVSL